MANSIAYTKNYTTMLDRVYQRSAVARILTSSSRMVRAGPNAKEMMVPKIEVTGLGDYVRNVGYKTGSITYEFETKKLWWIIWWILARIPVHITAYRCIRFRR